MFSDCEDDLCIFVCGTCKRYFTQLSAFSQHKKEQQCKKKPPGEITLKDNAVIQQRTHETSEENEFEESLVKNTSGLNETLNDIEDNSQRKYPRKQDKKLIKRTIRDLDNEFNTSSAGNLESFTQSSTSTTDALSLAMTSPEEQQSCKHPVYVCKSCQAEFPNSNSRVYKCADCRRGFYTAADLNQHMVRAKHNNLCAVCSKIFPDKYKLRKHELSHVTVKNFGCEEPGCTKFFKSAEDVRTHVRYVHAVEKRFHCTHCPRAFTRLDKYKLHMHTHGIILKPGPVPPTQPKDSLESNLPDTTPVESTSFVEGSDTPGTMALYHSTPVTEVVHAIEVSAGIINTRASPGHEVNTEVTDLDVVVKSDQSDGGSALAPHSSSSKCTNSRSDSLDATEDQNAVGQCFDLNQSSVQSQSEKGQECQKCQTRFQNSIEYHAHEERRADHVIRCGQCFLKYLSACELRAHVRETHGVQYLPQLESRKPPAPPKKLRKHFCQVLV